jgi:hypothetical protein
MNYDHPYAHTNDSQKITKLADTSEHRRQLLLHTMDEKNWLAIRHFGQRHTSSIYIGKGSMGKCGLIPVSKKLP